MPQKAKEVLVEPVLLLIDKVNVLEIVVPGVQELHISPPVKVAAISCKSLDVHEVAAGKVCADAVPEKSKIKNKETHTNALILTA